LWRARGSLFKRLSPRAVAIGCISQCVVKFDWSRRERINCSIVWCADAGNNWDLQRNYPMRRGSEKRHLHFFCKYGCVQSHIFWKPKDVCLLYSSWWMMQSAQLNWSSFKDGQCVTQDTFLWCGYWAWQQKIMRLLQGPTLATKKSGISWRAVQSPFYSWIIRATCTRSNYNTTLNTRPCQRTKRRSTGGSVAVGSILLLHAPCLCKYISAVTQVAWGMCKCSYVPCQAMPPHILVHIQTIFNHSTLFTMWLLL